MHSGMFATFRRIWFVHDCSPDVVAWRNYCASVWRKRYVLYIVEWLFCTQQAHCVLSNVSFFHFQLTCDLLYITLHYIRVCLQLPLSSCLSLPFLPLSFTSGSILSKLSFIWIFTDHVVSHKNICAVAFIIAHWIKQQCKSKTLPLIVEGLIYGSVPPVNYTI